MTALQGASFNELLTDTVRLTAEGLRAPVGDDDFSISVRDEGIGLPPGFDLRKAKGLGMRIINSFSQQLNATLSVRVQNPGTEFIVTIPRQSSTLTPDQN